MKETAEAVLTDTKRKRGPLRGRAGDNEAAGKQTALFLIGFVWTSLVAASRIVMGAHYLTDTIVGFAVGLMMLAGLCRILLPMHGKMPAAKA